LLLASPDAARSPIHTRALCVELTLGDDGKLAAARIGW
jgi:hypothetical protein